MGARIVHATGVTMAIIAAVCSGMMTGCAFAQDAPLEVRSRGVDPNNALIEGRVILPSGQAANFNIKIILSELHRPLFTIYTNKHAEFRFTNLREGVYYVQAVGDEKIYEPVTQKIWLGRSMVYQLSITLRAKVETTDRKTGKQVVSAAASEQSVPAAARKEYDQSVRMVGKGNIQQAIERLQRAVEIYPDYLDALNDLGAQYLKLKRFDEAAEQFRIVLEKNPKYFNSRLNLGLVLIEQKNYPIAIAQLKEAVTLDGGRPDGRLWLGVALLQIGDLAGAERELSKALIIAGTDLPATNYYLAQVYLRRGDTEEASRALKTYLKASPKGEYAEETKLLLKNLAKP